MLTNITNSTEATKCNIYKAIKDRILVLDGAMGTMLQRKGNK